MRLPRFEAEKPLLDQLTATRLNALLDYVYSIELQNSPTIRVNRTPSGTIAETKIQRLTPVVDHPFRVSYFAGADTDPSYIMVRIGVLYVSGSTVEITIDGNPLSNETTENTLAITLGASGGYIGLKLTVDDTNPYSITCSACEVAYEDEEPANTLTERWIRLAGISAAGAVNQEVYRTIHAARAGDYTETDSLQLW